MTALADAMTALSEQISDALCGTADPLISDLQVSGRFNRDPTPPSIDIYPADPFQELLGFGKANVEWSFSVRARVTIADHVAGQELLLSLMDTGSTTSLAKAITADRSLGGKVSSMSVIGPTGFGVYSDAGGQGSLLGAVWTVRVLP